MMMIKISQKKSWKRELENLYKKQQTMSFDIMYIDLAHCYDFNAVNTNF
jgi:hypothetical protein